MSKMYKNSNGQLLCAVPRTVQRLLDIKSGSEWDIVPNRSGGFTCKPKKGGR